MGLVYVDVYRILIDIAVILRVIKITIRDLHIHSRLSPARKNRPQYPLSFSEQLERILYDIGKASSLPEVDYSGDHLLEKVAIG